MRDVPREVDRARGDVVTRGEALAEAVKLVDELAPRVNQRGYSDNGVIRPAERIELVLKVADWLLAAVGDTTPAVNPFAPPRCAKCGRVASNGPALVLTDDGRFMHDTGLCTYD